MSIQFPASKSLCNDLAKASEALDGKKKLELLSGFLQEFGGIIDFTGSDLAEGQLSSRLCKSMDSGVFGGS